MKNKLRTETVFIAPELACANSFVSAVLTYGKRIAKGTPAIHTPIGRLAQYGVLYSLVQDAELLFVIVRESRRCHETGNTDEMHTACDILSFADFDAIMQRIEEDDDCAFFGFYVAPSKLKTEWRQSTKLAKKARPMQALTMTDRVSGHAREFRTMAEATISRNIKAVRSVCRSRKEFE